MTDTTPDRLYDSPHDVEGRREALRDGSIPIAVYGLGKMGLPLASVLAERTGSVIGVDVDETVVSTINDGESHVDGEPGLAELVAEQVDRGRLEATSDGVTAAETARVHVILVPTLVTETNQPDLSALEAVLDVVADGLGRGDLVVIESTVPPRTVRDVVAPTLVARSSLEPGTFGIAVCPERTSSGTALRDIRGRYPKVVGGIDAESARAATALYEEVTDGPIDVVSDATTAEAVKVFEGIYRDVNIALANELATTATELGISVREAMDTANELPVCDLHDPGPGVGGHCIPNYPHFLRDRTKTPTPVTSVSRRVNERMPGWTVEEVSRHVADAGVSMDEAAIAVLGVTYRPGVAELRTAPGIEILATLEARGSTVYAIDPIVDASEIESALERVRASVTDSANGSSESNLIDFDSTSLERSVAPTRETEKRGSTTVVALDEFGSLELDAAVVVTPHEEFERIEWDELEPMVIFDGRDGLGIETTRHRYRVLGGSADGETASTPSSGWENAAGRYSDGFERLSPPQE
ncbi:nucleotide sugar dehydrogenase [Halovivax gelatinilyticus]|uniref:nucleotide sugar dehydrogenase n=1 Tax=Halovivax gelatinilyticus TaxID=2961597 RepID=UPI0020CA695A|nr:nucleotide sugar dehydrogenase [Halovivax gelatinilyticus]